MRRTLSVLLVVTVLAFLAAGCGGGRALSLDPVASAATKAQQAGTYKFDFTAHLQVAGQNVSFDGSGVADEANQKLEMTMDFGGLLPASQSQNGTNAQFVIANNAMYMEMPFLSNRLPTGKQWLKVDLASLNSLGGGFGSFKQIDPQQYLQQLLASSNTRKVGADTVQGEQMTHYKTTVDIAKLDSVPPEQRKEVRRALKEVGMSQIPVDVWIDAQGLLRREQLDLTFGKALQSAQIAMTFDMHDFGAAVNVATPSADETYDASAFLQQMLGGAAAPATSRSEWATSANAVCRTIGKRYAGLGSSEPKTVAGQISLARRTLPIEVDELAQLNAISAPRSQAVTKALSLLRADLAEGRAAVAASGNKTQFKRLYQRWYNDHRAVAALGAAGATDCS